MGLYVKLKSLTGTEPSRDEASSGTTCNDAKIKKNDKKQTDMTETGCTVDVEDLRVREKGVGNPIACDDELFFLQLTS